MDSFLLGAIIKIYDDMVDNNIKEFNLYKEFFQMPIYILTFQVLLNNLLLSFFVVLAYIGTPWKDLADDKFWLSLGVMVGGIFLYNLYGIFNVNNWLELPQHFLSYATNSHTYVITLIALVYILGVYVESRNVTEEYSVRKLLSRILVLIIAIISYYFIPNQSIRQGIIIGSGYIFASILSQLYLHWDFYKNALSL